jgi:hypothetical protein
VWCLKNGHFVTIMHEVHAVRTVRRTPGLPFTRQTVAEFKNSVISTAGGNLWSSKINGLRLMRKGATYGLTFVRNDIKCYYDTGSWQLWWAGPFKNIPCF